MNVIVSGASKGIGAEIAKLFASQGHKVLAIARTKAKLIELKKTSINIQLLVTDITDQGLADKIHTFYTGGEGIDVLINNAGQLINKPFLETTLNDFRNQYEANVLTAINLVKACSPFFKKGSHIINISSMGGFMGSSKFSGLSAYSSSKGALSILTECLAEEFKQKGVRVNALALGAVQTEMLEKAFPDYDAPITAGQMAKYIMNFATEGGKYYNGKILPVTLGDP